MNLKAQNKEKCTLLGLKYFCTVRIGFGELRIFYLNSENFELLCVIYSQQSRYRPHLLVAVHVLLNFRVNPILLKIFTMLDEILMNFSAK